VPRAPQTAPTALGGAPGYILALPRRITRNAFQYATEDVPWALGVPTIAIYGPTNPIKWGPWPRHQAPDINPWRRCGTQQVGNVYRAFKVKAYVPEVPVLLVDDLVDTRWTMTVAGLCLRIAGSGPVHPLALATAYGD